MNRAIAFRIELMLGLALATGSFTSFRFFGPIGISEILFLGVVVSLLVINSKGLLSCPNNTEAYARIFILATVFFVLPIMTITSYFSTIGVSEPKYVLSYMIGALLLLLIPRAIEEGLDFRRVTIVFSVVFIIFNLVFLYLFSGNGRFSGGADNPNQLLFYGTSLSLLMAIYLKRSQVILFPLVTFVMYKTGSDAYLLSIFISGFAFITLLIFASPRLSVWSSLFVLGIFQLFASFVVISLYSEDIIGIWNRADEGGARLKLFYNSIVAGLYSPIVGFGAGSFSGLDGLFQGKEAHNTFLDLFNQFGICLPIFIYFLMISYCVGSIRERKYWAAGFVLAYLSSSLFHFSGRHFVFWVELAVFYHFVFYKQKFNQTKVIS